MLFYVWAKQFCGNLKNCSFYRNLAGCLASDLSHFLGLFSSANEETRVSAVHTLLFWSPFFLLVVDHAAHSLFTSLTLCYPRLWLITHSGVREDESIFIWRVCKEGNQQCPHGCPLSDDSMSSGPKGSKFTNSQERLSRRSVRLFQSLNHGRK